MKRFKKLLLGLVAFVTMAVLFAVCAGAETAGDSCYHAYIGFQTSAFSFRQAFDEANYGKDVADGKYFNGVVVWGGNDPETYPDIEDLYDYDIDGYVLPATYTDVVIDKDGTYRVGITDFDWALDGASTFNVLFVSTDIPFDKDAGEDGESIATFSDCKIIVDGQVALELDAPATVQESGTKTGHTTIFFANIWNLNIGSYTGPYPTKSLEIEFTVRLSKEPRIITSPLSDNTLMVTGYEGELVDFEIPETINGKKVTVIDSYAFKGCTTLKSIKIPDSIVSIGEMAFSGCSALESVTWSKGLLNIGNLAFADCVSLQDTVLPKNVVSIGNRIFYNCKKMLNITLPEALQTIGVDAFAECSNNLTITCCSGSAAETYAKENGIAYTLLDSPAAPKAVTGLKLGGRASNALRLNWTKNTTADGYIIEQYKSGKWVRIAKITSNSTTTYRVTGLSAGTAYKFRMKAYKMNGSTALYSDYTATLSARTNPSDITGLKLGGRSADALRLNWTKNASADGYIIEQYKSGKWVRIAKITNNATTTYRVSGLSAGTAYKFRMKAYKTSGSTALYSAYTSTLSACTNPSNVTGVKIGGKASNALRVNWTKNTSADGYIVEIYKGGKWVRAAKITKNTTVTYRISGLAKNTTYKIRIKAYKMSGSTALYSGYTTISGKTTA